MKFLTQINLIFPFSNHHKSHLFSCLCASSAQPTADTVVSAAVSILKHHRSKPRWSHLKSLISKPLTASQFCEIALQIRNNAHLALRFFHFTHRFSLTTHSLASYATIIHILSRSRLKNQALTLIKSAVCVFSDETNKAPLSLLEALVKTYRASGSAPFVFDLLVVACIESKKTDSALEIYNLLRSKNVVLRTWTCDRLIELVSKTRGCFSGYNIYREILHHKGVHGPSVSTFNTVMIGFHREGFVDEVEEVWKEMERIRCEPNVYSYNVLMAAYCDGERMEDAMRVWKDMDEKGLERDLVAYNTIIGGFCGVGEVARAEEIYREMVTRGIEGTCVTFEHLIKGYCVNGDVDSVILLYQDMCRRGFCPESSTVNVIVRSLCDKNEVDAATEFCRKALKKHDVFLEKENYQKLITGLCQKGSTEEALQFQAEMVRRGFEPDSEIYRAFIDGYVKRGNNSTASKLREEMQKVTSQKLK